MTDMPRSARPGRGDERLRLHPRVGEITVDGVLREYSDPGATADRTSSARRAIEQFVGGRARALRADVADLREHRADEGVNTLRIRYRQYLSGLPVFGAGIHAAASLDRAAVTRVANTVEADVADAPPPDAASDRAALDEAALRPFSSYGSARVTESTLGYLRDTADQRPTVPADDYPTASVDLLRTGARPDGRLHLVRDVRVESAGPFEQFRVVVDATTAEALFVELVGRYVAATGLVFLPDPVSESNSAALSSSSNAAALDPFRHAVTLDVDPAQGGRFRLQGPWFRCVDWDTPNLAVPSEPAADFSYPTYPSDRHFLNVNAYHWLDTFARYLRTLGNPTLNANMGRVDVDAQGFDGADNSEWLPGNPNRIRFGEGGVPDAADFGVIIHEYLHGVFDFLGSSHGGSGSYEHSFCDAIAAVFRDQHNPARQRRTETFPFDNNASDRWSTDRTLDRTERFDDPGFGGYPSDRRNSMLGTVIWQSYLGVGGDDDDPGVRQHAADVVIGTFLEMLLNVPDDNSTAATHAVSMAQGMVDADVQLTGGLHAKVFDAAAIDRGLWAPRPVDLWIADCPADAGAVPSPAPHWTSPDLWVRNLGPAGGDDPEDGHQDPIVGQPNHLYVRVHNRGTVASAAGFTVEAFHSDPGTGMTWPNDFTSMGTMPIITSIPPGGSTRIGPFLWTPGVVDHECLLAVVHGADDPAVTAGAVGSVPHHRLVRFDNNVGQRNVHPIRSVPGGKAKSSLVIRGSRQRSMNSLLIDATGMPEDTGISVRTLSRLVCNATLTDLTVSEADPVRSSLTQSGAVTGAMVDFPLAADEAVPVELVIDFSHEAEHLRRYPLVVTQIQDGQPAGRVTVDVVAIKELDDYFFGNPHSGEIHIVSCPFWERLAPDSKVPFARVDDALARGYNGCAHCQPDTNTG
ncbi:MAG TPA: hypothetical protein VIU11_25330 [Nakamurella sp.]